MSADPESILYGLRQAFEFVVDWIEYTPRFFVIAPWYMWWDYFGSCHRVCCMLMIGRENLRDD